MDTRLLKRLKASIVALGIVDVGQPTPKALGGTGFFIGPQGYIMTASHVIRGLADLIMTYRKGGIETELVACHLSFSSPRLEFHTSPIDEKHILYLKTKEMAAGSVMPDDLDITVMRLKKKKKPILNFLTFKKPDSALNLYQEVAMCGYPNVSQTLSLNKEFLGVRLSPITQFGKIVGLMPIDETPTANGIQTDILSTGGSSGSPIVDVNTGEVVAMAQQVIVAPVYHKLVKKPKASAKAKKAKFKEQVVSFAKIGLVYGITYNVLHNVAQNVPLYYEQNKPIDFPFNHTSFINPTFTRE